MEPESLCKKKELVKFFLDRGILVSLDFLENIEKADTNQLYETLLSKLGEKQVLLLNKDIKNLLEAQKTKDLNWREFERSRANFEKGENKDTYPALINSLNQVSPPPSEKQEPKKVNVLFTYQEKDKKKDIQDFVSFFNARYAVLKSMLEKRQELSGALSINKIVRKTDRGQVSVIGIVLGKQVTKNGNILLTLEDPTGTIKVLVNKTNKEAFEKAKDTVLDEVMGVNGTNRENFIFPNTLISPGIPLNKELKKSQDEAYAVFLSDLHVGSNNFLPEEFEKFLKWINLETGNEAQNEIAKKVKYIFIAGDLVDGVGIYPRQEKELVIKDIYEQYAECARLLSRIPEHITMIVCPGNHDAIRISEPQPIIYEDLAEPLWKLKNVVMVSNPSLINIHADENFPGFDVLMYHGYSFDYYIANVDSIRTKGGYDRADLMMSFLLERRHLAPTHTSTLYMPDPDDDPLIINKIPDFFITGHIHKTAVTNYKNITLICGSCWQAKTAFQEKVGHHPEPAKVPVVNLKTRQIKILNFGK